MQIRAWFSTISLVPVTGCKCDRSWPPRLAARQHGAALLQKIGQDAPGSAVFSQELPSARAVLQGDVCPLALETCFTQTASEAPGLEIKTSEKEKPI